MEKRIIPSSIAESQEILEKRINRVKNYVSWIHLDVMDGHFVSGHSLDFPFTLPPTYCRYEAHLMIQNPETWITNNLRKVSTFIVHYESCKNIPRVIQFLKENQKRIGIAVNPETPLASIQKYLNEIDQIVIMTVHPGAYGSRFLPKTLEKVENLRKLKPSLDIEVDGGITPLTIKQAADAGANLFVSGSYILEAQDVKDAILNLRMKFF